MNKVKTIDPELNRFLDIINTSVKKFRLLVTEIASVAKLENEAVIKEMVDMEEIISNVEWSLEEKIKQSGAVINSHIGVPLIAFSRKNMRSIMYNLISNAVRFKSDREPVVTVTTAKENDMVVLTVADNGIGMNVNDIENIWGKYSQLDASREGQGIGLFLTRRIVDSSGGYITVESTLGKGSKFMVHFS
jgi:signal transduction histidine kinase